MGRNRLVMVVEPDPGARTELMDLLRDAPYAVVADSGFGQEAVGIAADAQPEIVLAAVNEPVDEALATIEQLIAALPTVQVVAYSDASDMRVIRRIMQVGVRDLLPLPLEPDDLLAALGQLEAAVPRAAGSHAAPHAGEPIEPMARTAGTVLTVFGAKGGIGKSTIATNLAASIAAYSDQTVLIMDMDTRFGDIAIMLDMEPRYTISDLAQHAGGLTRETFRASLTEHESGAYVLAAPKHPSEWSNVTAEQMQEIVRFAARMFDYVILDTPGTFNDIVATSIEVADKVLVVSSLDMSSIKDTIHMLDLLEAEGFPLDRLLLVINQVNRATTVKASDVPQIVHQDVFWQIPYDEHVLLSNSIGQPIVLAKPKSGAAKELRGLADKITHGVGRQAQGGRRGILAIFTPWTLFTRRRAVA